MLGSTIFMPAADRSGGAGANSLSRLAPVNVFLVEDSPLLCEKIADAITDPGRVEVIGKAGTEGSAIKGVANRKPDAVIIDIRLREGNGINVLRSVVQMRGDKPLLIVLTNYAVPEYARECLTMGADYFFDKATEFDRVGEVLQNMASDRRRTTGDH